MDIPLIGEDKRLAKFLGVSEEKARELLGKYRFITTDPTPGAEERGLFKFIKEEEDKKKRKRGELIPDLTEEDELIRGLTEIQFQREREEEDEEEEDKDS